MQVCQRAAVGGQRCVVVLSGGAGDAPQELGRGDVTLEERGNGTARHLLLSDRAGRPLHGSVNLIEPIVLTLNSAIGLIWKVLICT